MAAQDAVRQGRRRSIGTGDDTFIWKIPWLPCSENGYMTTVIPTELQQTKVCNLMEITERRWDEEILNDICNNMDIKLIKSIPLSTTERQDAWFWIFEEKGEFTVKSCYRKLVGEYNTSDAGFWKKVWSLDLPGKVLHFLWRTCSLCLPTIAALREKRVSIDSVCSWCRTGNETDVHVLFECSFAKSVWESNNLSECIQVMPEETIIDMVKRLFSNASTERCVIIALMCWSIWNRWNRWVWNKIAMSVFGTKMAALNLLAYWKKVHLENVKNKPAANQNPRQWHTPPPGWVKINVDAAVFSGTSTIGIGSVIRDGNGGLSGLCASN